MIYKILQTVPICPSCQALMLKRYQSGKAYLFCTDCKSILEVLDGGKAENELIVTDGKETNG